MKFKVVEENQSKCFLMPHLSLKFLMMITNILVVIFYFRRIFSEIIKELKPQEKIIKTMVYEDPYPNHWLLTNSAIYISGKMVKDLNSNQRIINFIDLLLSPK